MLEYLLMNIRLRNSLSSLILGLGLAGSAAAVYAAPPAVQPGAPAVAAAPSKNAKPSNSAVPMVRQSPYARAVHDTAVAENAAIAQMQANGQVVPGHVARPAPQLAPSGKGGHGHGTKR
jgi:hypothetical protein